MSELVIDGLSVSYGHLQAVRNVSFTVPSGECVAILGRNGAGKSSLLRAIVNLVRHDGRVLLDGVVLRGRPDQIAKQGVIKVLEGRHIFSSMTVEENLYVSRLRRGKQGFADDLERVFAVFPVVEQRRKSLAGSLSGGQAQMVAIARALMASPSVLLLDEPSLGLAPVVVDQLADSLARFKQTASITMIVTDQGGTLAAALANKIYMFDRGQIADTIQGESSDIARKLIRGYFSTDAVG